jgi:dTDP-4-dehydrorhamnose reductase
MRVLVTGAGGQLGSVVAAQFAAFAEATALNRHDLDITNDDAVQEGVASRSPDVIVNCAAYNDVDGAEDDPASALQGNAFGVLALARAADACGATLVHYSTDFVFDGTSPSPYTEGDLPNPRSNYAMSKLLGEWFAAHAQAHYILRVESLFGGSRAKSSIDRILDALRSGRPARVFFDRTVTPSYVGDVADATARLLQTRAPSGLYHCVNTGSSTWLGVAEESARLLAVNGEIVPVSVKDVPMRAARPQYCALSNDKLRSVGISMPSWQNALARYIRHPGRDAQLSSSG